MAITGGCGNLKPWDVKICFDTDNAAFSDGNRGEEMARILEGLARVARQDGSLFGAGCIHDVNGNIVGECDDDDD